jgi:hypothetical protein
LKFVQNPEQVKLVEKALMGASSNTNYDTKSDPNGHPPSKDDAEAIAVLTYMFPGFEIRSLTDIG